MAFLAMPTYLEYGDRLFGDNDPIYGAQGSANQTARTLFAHLHKLSWQDTCWFEWKDNDTVTLKKGGVCQADDASQIYTIDADTDLQLSTGLDTGSEASTTYYWVWVGLAGGVMTFKFSVSATAPTGLTAYHRIGGPAPFFVYNNGSSNIDQFAPPLTLNKTCAGEFRMYGRAFTPLGAWICDGTAISRTDAKYARLFAALSTTWGVGDGSTTFNPPNLLGRAPIGDGAGAGLTVRTVAQTGGEENHALTSAENGTHNHLLPYNTPTNATAPGIDLGTYGYYIGTTYTNTTNNSGSGTAHNTMQPYSVVRFIVLL